MMSKMIANWSALFVALVCLSQFTGTNCLLPVFYPAASETEALVFNGEDASDPTLVPVQGSFSSFLCIGDTEKETTLIASSLLACSKNVVVHTKKEEFDFVFAVLDERGDGMPWTEEVDYQVDESLAEATPLPDSFIGGSRQESDEVKTVRVTLLEKETPVVITATSAGFTRSVTIFYDTTPPDVSLGGVSSGRTRATFVLSFGERVVPTQNTSCDASLPSFVSGTSVLNVLSAARNCRDNLVDRDFRTVLSVEGADSWKVEDDLAAGTATVTAFVTNGLDANLSVVVQNGAIMDFAGNLAAGGLGEFVNGSTGGNKTFTLSFEAPPPLGNGNDSVADAVGAAASAAVVTTVAATAVTAVGSSVAAQVVGGAAGGSTSGTLGGGLQMLNMGQKVYFTSLVASTYMPKNYKIMASNLKWTALRADIPLDFSDSEGNFTSRFSSQSGSNRKLLQDTQQDSSSTPLDAIEDAEDFLFRKDPHETARRVFFWVFVLFGGLLAFHLPFLFLMCLTPWRVPKIFELPRLELYASEWAVPAIAAASGALMTGDKWDSILGAIVFVMFPGAFLVWCIQMLWRHFYNPAPHERGANLVIHNNEQGDTPERKNGHSTPSTESGDSKQLGDVTCTESSMKVVAAVELSRAEQDCATKDGQLTVSPLQNLHSESLPIEGTSVAGTTANGGEENRVDESTPGLLVGSGATSKKGWKVWLNWETWDKYVLTPVLGPKQEKVAWVSTRSSKARFVERYGPMFEDYRGLMVVHRGHPQPGNSAAESRAERQDLINPLPQKPLFTVRSIRRTGSPIPVSFYKHHIQTAMGVLLLAKLIFFAVLIHGEEEREDLTQLVILLSTSVLFYVLIRTTQPFVRRMDMAVALLAEVADIIVFMLAIVVLSSSVQSDPHRRNIGIAMIFFQILAFLVLFVEKMSIVCEHIAPAWAAAKRCAMCLMDCCAKRPVDAVPNKACDRESVDPCSANPDAS